MDVGQESKHAALSVQEHLLEEQQQCLAKLDALISQLTTVVSQALLAYPLSYEL